MFLFDEVIKAITEKNLLGNPLDLLDENEPKSDDSLATLINKLSCSTTQMWHSQDMIYKMRFMSREEFLHTYGSKMEEVHECLKRGCDLNVQRARLMDAIDRKLFELKGAK